MRWRSHRRLRLAGLLAGEDVRDRQFANHLGKFYDDVIACIRDAESIQIFGPGEAKGELEQRLKGKGLPKAGATGDLFVTTKIILPDGNDAELEALMNKWRDGHPYNPRTDSG